MPFIYYKINVILTWLANYVIKSSAIDHTTIFAITDTKPYVPVVTLSTEENAKLLQQLTPGFKRTINQDKYQSKLITQAQNQY